MYAQIQKSIVLFVYQILCFNFIDMKLSILGNHKWIWFNFQHYSVNKCSINRMVFALKKNGWKYHRCILVFSTFYLVNKPENYKQT